MSERERWVIYPLLFLALGVALRDKVMHRVETRPMANPPVAQGGGRFVDDSVNSSKPAPKKIWIGIQKGHRKKNVNKEKAKLAPQDAKKPSSKKPVINKSKKDPIQQMKDLRNLDDIRSLKTTTDEIDTSKAVGDKASSKPESSTAESRAAEPKAKSPKPSPEKVEPKKPGSSKSENKSDTKARSAQVKE